VFLPSGQHQAHRQAILIDQSTYLGAQSSTRAADSVIFIDFFSLAACWRARMIKLPINALE
jgi:hypothetical protein